MSSKAKAGARTAPRSHAPSDDGARVAAGKVPTGTVVRYPDGRVVMLCGDELVGGRMGRVVDGDVVGEFGNWIAAATEVEVLVPYAPPQARSSGPVADPLEKA